MVSYREFERELQEALRHVGQAQKLALMLKKQLKK